MTYGDRLSSTLRRVKHAAPLQTINLVERPRLTARLDEALERRLVVVAAPAGFGKTTLLAQWRRALASRGAKVAWLTLDDEDRETRRFLAGLIFAAEDAGADIGQLRAWAEQGLMEQTPSAVAAALAEAVARDGGRFVFMLDDFHRAQTADVNRMLDALLGALGPGITVALGARTPPHALMVRWMGFGQAAEIDAAMLRFSRDEALAVFGDPAGGVFEDVFGRTEGWPIALQLSRLVAERAPDRPVVPAVVTSEDLAAYLSDQVLSELSADTQDFMLLTAHLDRFDADLADAALDRADGSAMLEGMRPLGTILVALDDRRRWFRHHHLVADVLQGLARRRLPARIGPTLLRASLWFEARGETEDAVRYAARAGDHARCAALIERAGGWRMILHGGIGRLRGLLSHMPDHALAAHPRVMAARAYLAIKDGDVALAGRLVAAGAEVLARGGPDDDAARDLAVIDCLLDIYADRLVERGAVQAIRRGREAAPADDHLFRSVFDATEAWACLLAGDFAAAADATQRASRSMRRAGSLPGANYCRLVRGFGRMSEGGLDDAQESFLESARLAEENFGADSGLRALAQIGLSSLSFWRVGWSEEDAERFTGALEHVRRYDGWFEVFATGLEAAFAAAESHDDVPAMRARVGVARRIASERDGQRLTDVADAFALILHVRLHERAAADAAATALAARFPLGGWTGSPFLWRCHFHAGLALARWAGAADPAAALARIDDVVECCRRIGADLFTTRALAARAEALERAARPKEAADAIAEALSAGAGQRIAAPFRGAGVRALVQRAARAGKAAGNGDATAFAAHCLRAESAPAQLGPDALSPREFEVLCQLSRGGSNKTIARALGMTDHTVKFHLRSIFRKLGVETRAAAVAAALDVQGFAAPSPDRLVR